MYVHIHYMYTYEVVKALGKDCSEMEGEMRVGAVTCIQVTDMYHIVETK